MVSLALLPCSYTDGARLIGELGVRLKASVYTDELMVSDVAEAYGIKRPVIKKWLYCTAPPENRLTLEKEKLVNLCKHFIAGKLSREGRVLLYGYHAAMVRVNEACARKILITDRVAGRVKRAMKEEGWNERQARMMIQRHDRKLSQWTQFLFGREVYDPELYDRVVSFENRLWKEVIAEIETIHEQAEADMSGERARVGGDDILSAVAVERVLLERGYKADVRVNKGQVRLLVEVSRHHYPWLADKLTELTHSVRGGEGG